MINVAVVEDEKMYSDTLIKMLRRYEGENNVSINIHTFNDGLAFLDAYHCDYEIIFMDIYMPYISGMETAKRLREIDEEVSLVFVTNIAQYALEAYEVFAVSFFVKPIKYYPLSVLLNRVIRKIQQNTNTELVLNTSSGTSRIDRNAIMYVEVKSHYLFYHTKNNTYSVRGTMKEVEEAFSKYGFVKCNNSYLVNLRYVNKMDQTKVYLSNDEVLSISRTYKKHFMTSVANYFGGYQ